MFSPCLSHPRRGKILGTTCTAAPRLVFLSRTVTVYFQLGWPHAARLSNSCGTRPEWHNKRVAAVSNPNPWASSRGSRSLGWMAPLSRFAPGPEDLSLSRAARMKRIERLLFGYALLVMKYTIFEKWFRQRRDHVGITRRARRSSASLSSTQTRLRLLRLHDSSRNLSIRVFIFPVLRRRSRSAYLWQPATIFPSYTLPARDFTLIAGSAEESCRICIILRVCIGLLKLADFCDLYIIYILFYYIFIHYFIM